MIEKFSQVIKKLSRVGEKLLQVCEKLSWVSGSFPGSVLLGAGSGTDGAVESYH